MASISKIRYTNVIYENGNKRYKIEVCAEEFNFVNSKRKNNNENKAVME